MDNFSHLFGVELYCCLKINEKEAGDGPIKISFRGMIEAVTFIQLYLYHT